MVKRTLNIVARVMGALMLLSGAAGLCRAQSPSEALRVTDLTGSAQTLSAYRSKIVVLNFWATWCVPCREEMPLLDQAQKKFGERVAVIAVSLDDAQTRAAIEPFVRKARIRFPVWVGATPDDLERLGLGKALPATAFLDGDGRVVGRVLGQLRKKDLFPRVEWMLGERHDDEPAPLVNNLNK